MDDILLFNSLIEKMNNFSINPRDKIAVYGTGDGARKICNLLKKKNIFDQVLYIIEQDDNVNMGGRLLDRKISRLEDCYQDVDIIIIGAYKYHAIIKERLEKFYKEHIDSNYKIIDLFSFNTQDDELEYLHFVERAILKEKSKSFVEFDEIAHNHSDNDTKVIAWYLPQYHEIEINNKYLGQGFTEWTNTTRACPVYTGHYQPHIPYDVGYYNLNNIETFRRQIFLAKHYGIYGFSFYYYWFSGTSFMKKPLDTILKHPELDINFCITWANENWTTLWDGGQREVIYRQMIKEGDAESFIDDILPVISDPRYITIDNCPLIIVYRGNLFDEKTMSCFFCNMRKRAKYNGFKDLYIMVTTAGNFNENVSNIGADALVEFPPHGMEKIEPFRPKGYINPYFVGKIFNTERFIREKSYMVNHKEVEFYRGALTSWDNTARKARTGAHIFYGLSPATFKQWLWDIVSESKKIHSGDSDMVFVNSWNEWAEGSHLEPDMKYGYAYLQAVKEVLEGKQF